MIKLLILLFPSLVASAEMHVSVLSAAPAKIGSGLVTRVRFSARLGNDPRLNEKSVALYQAERTGELVGDALCKLEDSGDSRTGDTQAGDFEFACMAELKPRWPTTMYVAARASYGTRRVISRPFAITVVDGKGLRVREDLSEKEQVMQEARAAWTRNRQRFGLTDQAVAVTVREVEQLDQVKEVRRNTSNDIIILFKTGGMDQLSTFDPNSRN